MLSPRRGLLSPCPIGEPHHAEREREREREEESEAPTSKGTRRNEPVVVGRAREPQGTGEIYLPGRIAVAKSSQESDKPTTEAHPPHYAHRSRDFNVPLEMAACCLAASCRAALGNTPRAKGAHR